ncbi:hypothetical protein L6164_000383 [Bauhinia variegata]|uniref:Uncharacterized protein n=1 Tax=Bauhinia variegata TaxID=167791 RepID=A0ACB9Q5K9_BAUVA|nr:hypothetical protein L6164_000383 [Bauhinia variegata]
MASSEQQGDARTIPAVEIVGNAFVDQYYHMLHENPEHVHRFYQDGSKLGRLGENGFMDVATTMQEINEKILSLGYSEFNSEIVSMDAQESFGGGVLILVTGFMTGKDTVRRKFTQSFFLAPQDKGYFVLNDVFRYVDGNENQGPVDDVESPVNPDQDPSIVPETTITKAEDFDGEEVYNPENGQASIEEEPPVPEVVDEVPDDSQMVAGSTSKIEEVPKKSYASIVKVMKETPSPSSTLTAAPARSAPKIQEQQVTAAPAPPSVSEATGSNASANGSGNNQETEAEGYSIYLKGLPSNATPFLLENEFKRFGTIKSGGIQVRTQRGFCFGFVEFEEATAVQSAIEASPIIINGRHVVVEEKKSTNRGNSRGRFSSGRGAGFRNEGARARGNYGNGRSYDRGDNNGRGDFGYRNGNRGDNNGNRGGAFSNRGRDGYQRNDQMGGNGGRVNRTGGLAVNLTAKTTSVRVPATA